MDPLERYATGIWLDRRAARSVSHAMIAATLATLALLFATGTGTLDLWGRPLGTDFSNVWTAGAMAQRGEGAAAYDWALHYREQQALHGSATVPFYSWQYPPIFLLVAAPLAGLPYLWALAAWQAVTLGLALSVVRRIRPDRDTVLVALGCPAVLVCLMHGHNGFLTAALFGAGLLCLDRRPVLAGILLGCLAYKPHFGLVLPFALLAGGSWRAILAATCAVLALVALSTVAFGPAVWPAFLASTELTRTFVLQDGGIGWFKMQSAFAASRMWGAGLPLAYGVQALVALAAVAGTAWLWRARAAFELRAAGLMLAALLATPYVLDYDMVLLGPAVAFLVAHAARTGFARWDITLLALAWFAPLAARPVASATGVPLGVAVMASLFVLVLRRAAAEAHLPAPARPLAEPA